ncbi:MAG: hypothetical protein DHS20C20_24030 [Ardenticatenaceae bacterium]|nr:MAG: hypothetical protein DHS20C20_24030 [Ardenticatenaceae bacterium]
MADVYAQASGDYQHDMNPYTDSQEPQATINQLLAEIAAELTLSQETKQELLTELRDHLEDAWETAVANNQDPTSALQIIVRRFGGAEVGHALQQVHAQWESSEAILACLIPVLATLVLRWVLFTPAGAMAGWQSVLVQPAFWLVAFALLLIPVLHFQRWRYVLVNWGFFWVVTLIFVLIPAATSW